MIRPFPPGFSRCPAYSDNAPGRYIVATGGLDGPGTGLWTPEQKDIEQAEKALRLFLATPSSNTDSSFLTRMHEAGRQAVNSHYDSYALQFSGVRRPTGKFIYDTEGKGPKAISISGFCKGGSIKDDDLQKGEVLVSDGGSCYFRAVYDVDRNEIIYFSVNGRA